MLCGVPGAPVRNSSALERKRRSPHDFHAFRTASKIAGAAWPLTRRRPSANCPLRMRFKISIPATVIAALSKSLKPSIGQCVTSRLGDPVRSCLAAFCDTAAQQRVEVAPQVPVRQPPPRVPAPAIPPVHNQPAMARRPARYSPCPPQYRVRARSGSDWSDAAHGSSLPPARSLPSSFH
jgi:hypothetical protein